MAGQTEIGERRFLATNQSATEKKLEIALGFIRDRAEGLQGEDPRDVLFVIEHVPDIRTIEPSNPLVKCEACSQLVELYEAHPQHDPAKRDREYWLMTELFVKLHGGKDHCE